MARKSLFSRIGEGIQKTITNIQKSITNIPKNIAKTTRKKTPDPNINKKEPKINKTSTRSQNDISQLISRVEPVIRKANERWRQVESRGLISTAISRALYENNDEPYFSVSQLNSREEIIAEATRARVFLNDKTSTIKGAELYTQQESAERWRGEFSGDFYNEYGKTYNTNVINEDYAKMAFSIYRRLEELEAARIMGYGSENMIIQIYDIVYEHGETGGDFDDLTDLTEQARDFLDRAVGEKYRQFERAFRDENRVNSISEIVTIDDDYLTGGGW